MMQSNTSAIPSTARVKAANANTGTTELIETNEKQVNEVFLTTAGKNINTFTAEQANTLFAIANQCPMVGGNAVYKARALYRMIDDEQQFDDPLLCLAHGIIVKSMVAAVANTVSVVPNPAQNEAALILPETLNASAVFIIFNTMGAEIIRFIIPMEMERFEFSTASLAPGLYHYTVRGPTGEIGFGKIAIIR